MIYLLISFSYKKTSKITLGQAICASWITTTSTLIGFPLRNNQDLDRIRTLGTASNNSFFLNHHSCLKQSTELVKRHFIGIYYSTLCPVLTLRTLTVFHFYCRANFNTAAVQRKCTLNLATIFYTHPSKYWQKKMLISLDKLKATVWMKFRGTKRWYCRYS